MKFQNQINDIETLNFLSIHLTSTELNELVIIRSRDVLDIESVNNRIGICNLTRFNNIIRINKYFETVNSKLENGDYYISCFESMATRKEKLFKKHNPKFSKLFYYLDFMINRVLPRISITKGLYFYFTRGKNRVLSITEGLGRLVSCGFDIIDYKTVNSKTYVISKKISSPRYDLSPTYGALVRLKRIGYAGSIISSYKFRTMYPFSEYIQDYIFKVYGTSTGDKFNNDFRVTSWGRFFRKYWIDEIPMVLNWIKGDLKIVGVRPLSVQKFSTYPKYLQNLRIKVKPGLIPPYYADMPSNPVDFFKSEERYILSYIRNPIKTDITYFFKAIKNIVLKNARSK